jgi:two-component system, chemotaxis family, sensor histidine kinase and response regulator WspE
VSSPDFSGFSMHELFRLEAEAQAQVLTAGLLGLERDAGAVEHLEACMRSAHSLKGAARVVDLPAGVRIAHAMEECFVAAQHGRLTLYQASIDQLLGALDLLTRIASIAESEIGQWVQQNTLEIETCLSRLDTIVDGATSALVGVPASAPAAPQREDSPRSDAAPHAADRVLRISAESLNHLLALAGESLIESRWVNPFAASLSRLKKLHDEAAKRLHQLHETLAAHSADDAAETEMLAAQRVLGECQQLLSERLVDLDMFDRRSSSLSRRLYDEALACRMRPFGDGVRNYPRVVRDLGRSLDKQARLEIIGDSTQVDRDLLEKLDAPLGHLLRNAVDHGIESPHERRAAGKSDEAVIRLEAVHQAGRLLITVSDDGRGIDLEQLRASIIARNLATAENARALSEAELLEFLFLPSFTMKDTVTDTSGRGVGLDAVRDMVKQVRGSVRISSTAGAGTRIQLELPVTLSVVRALLVEIGGEPYAFPLTSVLRAVKVPSAKVGCLEGRRHFDLDGRTIGIIPASQLLDSTEAPAPSGSELPVIVVGDATHAYGLSVDRFLFERELVVQPLDSQLGKLQDIAAGALMENGAPVLIVDAEDLMRSCDRIADEGRVASPTRLRARGPGVVRKRVLVVDDSLTVRELERKLLSSRGYDVDVAVDGVDGWNAVRNGNFNLVVTDVDMPRMDGIELVRLINKDPNLKSMPVMVVSYKDREEDRRRGLEAGATYYLSKGSFHDETLVQAVVDLIGEAAA